MEQKPRIVALVPVRGGSKSIPLKNIRPIAGKPLCLWVLEAACCSKMIDKVYASTDSQDISDAIKGSLLPVKILLRDAKLATDTASTESVMIDFMDRVDFDILVTIQATSPMTASIDFDNALNYFLEGGFDSLVTGVRSKKFFWTGDKSGNNRPVNYDFLNRPRRQDFDGFIMENGAFYITKRKVLKDAGCRLGGKIAVFEMLPETGVEIDEPADWEVVENLLIERKKRYLKDRVRNIKMFIMDVDGVLTDSFVYLNNDGIEMKRFSVRDGFGIGLIRELGIKTAIITKEKTKIVEHRAAKLKIDYVYKGADNKIEILKDISDKLNIPLKNIAYIGDDINDLEVLGAVGFSAAPNNAEIPVKNIVDYICKNDGGCGCVREICEIMRQFHT